MSIEGSSSGNSTSQSGSSGSSPNQPPFFQEHIVPDIDLQELSLCGVPAPRLFRSGTVKRANSTPIKRERYDSSNGDSDHTKNTNRHKSPSPTYGSEQKSGKLKKLNNKYRRSLDSINESKPKTVFSPSLTLTSSSRDGSSSLESFSSDPADYHAIRSNSDTSKEGNTIQSPSASYLTWIESIKSDYYGSAITRVEPTDVDIKVGEWNNFWLNYSNARSRYASSTYRDEKIVDENCEARSSCSTQKEIIEKTSSELVSLSLDEIQEVLRCSKRITEIFQNALNRNDQDIENSNVDTSYYSNSFSRQASLIQDECRSFTKEDFINEARQRSSSYIITSQDLLRQKESLRPSVQSSSTSCINAILNSGVAEILKKVMNKRREVLSDDHSSMTRRSFSDWSNK